MAITLSGDYVESVNYDDELELSAVTYDKKGQKLILIYETHDGTGYTGKQTTLVIDANGGTATKLDGTEVDLPSLAFTDTEVAATISETDCATCITDNYTPDA
jgi:Zn-dependent metalloprotease